MGYGRNFRIKYLGGQEVLVVKILDFSKNVAYKAKANVHDKKRIKEIFESLRSFGVDIDEVMRIEDKKKFEEHWW
jgi:hypothetical protein